VAERARAFHTDLTENRKWRIRNGCMHLWEDTRISLLESRKQCH
jgi:hypothetical protein